MGKNLFSYGDNVSQTGTTRVGKFFSSADGSPGSINVRYGGGNNAQYEDLKTACIITSIKYVREVAHQPEPTLGGELYINIFGDKPTRYFLEGMAFDAPLCETSEGRNSDPGASIIAFYDAYKLRELKDNQKASDQIFTTIYNTIGGKSINYNGFLVSLLLDLVCEESGVRRYQFSLMFLAVT